MRIEPQDRSKILKQMREINWRLLLAGFCIVGVLVYALLVALFTNLPDEWAVAIAALVSASVTWWLWHYSIADPNTYRSHYILNESGYLQIKGFSSNTVLEVRFKIAELKSVKLGRRSLLGMINPIVRSIEDSTLIIEETNGSTVTFDGVGWMYSKSDLLALIESASGEIARHNTI